MDAENTQEEVISKEEQPSTEASTPSTGDRQTFTKEEVDKLIASRHSALDKKIAELTKRVSATQAEVAAANKRADEATAALTRKEKEEWDAKLAAAQGDPDLMAKLNLERSLKDREAAIKAKEADIDARIAEFESDFEALNEAGRIEYAAELADELGISKEVILAAGDTEPGKMKETAERLAKALKPVSKPSMKADSGVGLGVGVNLEGMSPKEKIAYAIAHPRK